MGKWFVFMILIYDPPPKSPAFGRGLGPPTVDK